MLSSSQFHSDFKALIISVLEVSLQGLKLEQEIKANALTALLAEPDATFSWQALDPVFVSFFIEQENAQSYIVHVKSELKLYCACVRCLNLIAHLIPLNFSIRMLAAEEEKQEEALEISLDSDSLLDEGEMPVGYFLKRSIDLGLILREQIFLEVPDYPKCGGLMAINKEPCESLPSEAKEAPIRENPFAKLLKKPK